MVRYNFRRVPAVTLAKQLIDEGRLGRVFHYRAKFLQDWTISADLPQGGAGLWRLDASVAGSGVTGDLLAHCIDTAMWLNGPIDSVTGMTETFVKERTHNLTGKAGGDDRRCGVLARSPTVARHFRRPARAATRRNTRSKERRERLISWDGHRSASAAIFHQRRRRLRGWRSAPSPTVTNCIASTGVPGLQITRTYVRPPRRLPWSARARFWPDVPAALATDFVTDAGCDPRSRADGKRLAVRTRVAARRGRLRGRLVKVRRACGRAR
jgi:myo-inositol 2-dehydrogenase/D-chiro-inositol 1-dehydrogenase